MHKRWIAVLAALTLVFVAGATAAPNAVTIAGSLQSEAGCPGDWDPGCALTHLTYDASDDVWQGTFDLPAGSYEYKAALNNGWDENYGLHAEPGGANIPLNLPAAQSVKFYYDHKSHWITDNLGSTIVVAAGSFQSELGCPGDWQPDCLRSWLQDPDGDGTYTFTTTALPAGNYEAKAALNESWDVNYGQGGAQNGDNIPFHVPFDHAKVEFRYDNFSHVLTITAGHAHDNNVEWDGLRFDSRDTLYRTPSGAVPAGTPVTFRFRTFHDDATGVKMRVYDTNTSSQQLISMQRVASGVSCYQESLAGDSCDYWQARLANPTPNVDWYRFIVADGTATAYYADDTPALDGGLGRTTSDLFDFSYALTVYDPSFTAPAWVKNAVIYQIFPDRFRNADKKNDPPTGTVFYDLQSILKPWTAKPEGYCRAYDSACNEGPRGRDFFGGDLKGVRQKLEYIHGAGFNTIYLNPIFWAKSNHRYDTADYLQIDPYLGDEKDFEQIVQQAHDLGMHIILDGVFNHMSSDSPFFDRYHHYQQSGACESTTSQWRSWFVFGNNHVPCASGDYTGWFGFDTIPVLQKSNPAVQSYFITGSDSVAKHWLKAGSNGWRLDVMGDPSFPDGYWQSFRKIVKQTDPNALIVGELWQKDTTLLRLLRGDAADTTMNYRLRDVVNGYLAGDNWDPKGFGDSGHSLTPSQVASRLLSQREDYAPAAYTSLMNLIDSHDTARALWTFTPGAYTTADKENNAANLAEGKQRLRLASLLQYTLAGAPTVYYGDEVGVTGNDDPDNRRTYPWQDTGGKPDNALLAHYTALGQLRRSLAPLVSGDLKVLLADDASGVLAYGRKTGTQAAIVVLNRSSSSQTVDVPLAGYLPDGTALTAAYGSGGGTVSGGKVSVTVPAIGGVVLATGQVDLAPPAAPTGLAAEAGAGQVALHWNAADGATGYDVYRSPVTGGGYVKVNGAPVTGTSFTDTAAVNGRLVYYVVRALDAAGNVSADSNEVSATPHLVIGYAVLQWPKTIDQQISATPITVYGQVYVAGATDRGDVSTIRAQVGFGPVGSNPDTWTTWIEAAFNPGHTGDNNAEYQAGVLFPSPGSYDYLYRFTDDGGASWIYGDQDGYVPGGSPGTNQPGRATIHPSSDTTAPTVPQNVHVVSASPGSIEIAWDASSDPDDAVAGYDVLRSTNAGGPYEPVGTVTGTDFVDLAVDQGSTYYYVVRAFDGAQNRSGNSAEVSAQAALRTVTAVFTVTVPAATDGTGRSVYIAGTLDRLDPPGPAWDPGAVVLTRVDATHWQITLHGQEGTNLEYKYTLGDWDHVEKDGGCGEIANRQLTLSYGSDGTQNVNDTVPNWRGVPPCGS